MIFEIELVQYLKDAPGMQAVVDDRIYPLLASKTAVFPMLVIMQISGPRQSWFEGASGLCDARYQIDCIGQSYKEIKETAKSVRQVLNGFSGRMGAAKIVASRLENEQDDFNEKSELFRVIQDYFITLEED